MADTVYITKYCLSRGIQKAIVASYSTGGAIFIREGNPTRFMWSGEWHETREAALKKAEEMRLNKIASLNRQLKKLKEMKFTEES